MSKRTEFKDALVTAMKAKEQVTVDTVRLINAKLKEKDIEARGAGNQDGIGEPEILSMLQGMIKQRQESADIYAKNGRPELAEKENAEIAVIERFLPKQMSEAEVKAAIDALIAETGAKDIKDMGKVMGAMKSKYAGQVDMAKASALIREKLAA
jgi:uncharacterized protein YqeY